MNNWIIPILALFIGCANDHGNPVPAEASCASAGQDTISFQKDILPVFATSCATSGCHSGSTPSGNLNLENTKAYAQLAKKGSGYLIPSNPTASVLYSQLISVSQPMPPTGKLSSCNIQLIENWISQGAKNN